MFDFNTWTLSRQLHLSFMIVVILFSGLTLTIIRLQLDWIKSESSSKLSSVLKSENLKRMQFLAQSECSFLSTKLSSYIKITSNLKELNRLAFDQIGEVSQPFADWTPFWLGDSQGQIVISNTSAYCSSSGKAIPGSLTYETIANASRVNWVLTSLYSSDFSTIIEGFNQTGIINTYPSTYFQIFQPCEPFIRNWYYAAEQTLNVTALLDPYTNTVTGDRIVTVSKSINLNNDSYFGVVALEVLVDSFVSGIKNVTVLESGFVVLVTFSGRILQVPEYWGVGDDVRIYDEAQTGFSSELWEQVLNASEGEDFQFVDVNGTEFTMVVGMVKVMNVSAKVSYLLLVFAENKQIYKRVAQFDDQFSSVLDNLFWGALAWGLVVCVVALVIIHFYCIKMTEKLNAVNKVFVQIRRRAIFCDITKLVKFEKLEKVSDGIEEVVEACEKKVKRIRKMEKRVVDYCWGCVRPKDEELFCRWTEVLYPVNKFFEEKMKFREAIDEFKECTELNKEG